LACGLSLVCALPTGFLLVARGLRYHKKLRQKA
jgi:hypothetical protein